MKHKKIALLVICLTIILCLYGCKENNSITEFSAENWRSVDENQRYHMLEDLYAAVELVGMTSDEVIEETAEEVHNEQELATDKESQYKLLCNSEKEYVTVVSAYKEISSDIWYIIDDFNQNGRLEMIFAIRNGTALYTDFTVFEVNETFDGTQRYQFADSNTYMKNIITGEVLSDSVPDIITDTVNWTKNTENNHCEYYLTDRLRTNPGEYYNGYYKVWFEENLVHQELIAYKFQNTEQDTITYYDMLGNEITEVQFDELFLSDAEQNEKTLNWNLYITEEERDYFTDFFRENGGDGFVYCEYDRPQDVDLNLVFYGAQTEEWDEKELEETGFDYGFIAKSEIDKRLMKFLGLTNEQMTKPLFVKERNGEEVVAWLASDALNVKPICVGGYKNGDTYTLLMDAPLSALTLRKNGDDSVAIISNRILDNYYEFFEQ